jgi:ribosomal protein S18 acetylase RimI-like enzyme
MKIRKACAAYKKHGFKGILKTIKNRFITEAYAYEYRTDCLQNLKFPGFSFEPLTIELLGRMCKEYPAEISSKKYGVLKGRLNKDSAKGYIMLDKGEIAGFCHIEYGEYVGLTNYVMKKEKGAAYLFDAHVFKKHRKKGVHTFDIYSRLKEVKANNCRVARVVVIKGNIGAERAFQKFGFKRYLQLKRYRIGPIDRTFARKI